MAKYKPQHSRLLFIDKKIHEGKYPNCSSLAEEWEVSSKTIHRDLDYMRYQLDAPLEYSTQHRGYFYTEENFSLPALSIKESDLFALYLAEELLMQYQGTPLHDRLSSIFKKIEDALPEKIAIDSSHENTRFTVFAPPSTTICPDVWEAVFKSLKTLDRLEIEYHPPGQVLSKRLLDPYHAVRYDGDWYVTGLCHLRKQIRTFSLSRITKASSLERKYTIPSTFDFHKISSSRFGVHWGEAEEHVKIWFSSKVVPYILERKWHPSQEIKYNEDGSLVLSLTIDHLLELKRWVLSWGKEARVIEPEKLVLDLQSEIGGMSICYSS
jgi:predicted DNA-binding transcriptional regulator YafY